MQEVNAAKQVTPPTKDVYGIITERIIEQLEKGTVPWQKPWTSAGIPKNLISGKAYRGVNIIMLASLGFEQNSFLTFKQIQEIGAKVKKDEKGFPVVYWNITEQEQAEPEGESAEAKKSYTLRYYTVFNIAQCENIPDNLLEQARIVESNSACEDILTGMQDMPVIRHKENKAFYNPVDDYINMPKQKSFTSNDAYYATLFHELVHSTGHHSRLGRDTLIQMSEFGWDMYSQEELVAEIGACFLQCLTGITSQFENNTAYIQGWLWKLKNDRRFIYTAASAAQKAVDHILNVQSEQDESKVL